MTDENENYFNALQERVGKPPKKTVPYDASSDPFFASTEETLNSPPFRPPTPEEILAELPVPECTCLKARYTVFPWNNPTRESVGWYLQMHTALADIPEAKYCPFCGDALPALVRRKNLAEGFPAECYYSTPSK